MIKNIVRSCGPCVVLNTIYLIIYLTIMSNPC